MMIRSKDKTFHFFGVLLTSSFFLYSLQNKIFGVDLFIIQVRFKKMMGTLLKGFSDFG